MWFVNITLNRLESLNLYISYMSGCQKTLLLKGRFLSSLFVIIQTGPTYTILDI